MRDIFICYSSHDKKYAFDVCSLIEKEGPTCWVSYRYSDLQPGINYTERITEAIDKSKIFVILLSNFSISSEQVRQELILANERQRYGLKIFPVIIDCSLNLDDVHRYFGYVLAGKEYVQWNNEDSMAALINQIKLILGNHYSDECTNIKSKIPKTEFVVGRDKELQIISNKLLCSNRLEITGLGGIGKTAVLRAFSQYALDKQYKSVIYLSIDQCLLRTIDNDSIFPIDSTLLKEKRDELSDYEYAMLKLSIFENSVDDKVLLILDNFEIENDPLLDRICRLKCALIIASRYSHNNLPNFDSLEIKAIKNRETIKELFELYYGSKLDQSEDEPFYSLCENMHHHTLAIIMVAKQMCYFGKKPTDYKDLNELQIERVKNLSQLLSGRNIDTPESSLYHLLNLFNTSTLNKEETIILKTLSLLPSEGINRGEYNTLLGNAYLPFMFDLEKRGWVQFDSEKQMIFIHPLTRDVILHSFDNYIEDPDISDFLSNFFYKISQCWNSSFADNIKLKQLALSIYYLFPDPVLSRYKEYLELSRFLWVMNCTDISLEIQNKLKQLFAAHTNTYYYSSEEAETHMQIGFIYQWKGDYSSAEKELTQSAKIFGTKYAAAITHLAQAKMSQSSTNIDEIEPLLKESLSIRERLWSGTVSEAMSCHLYAKALSHYEVNLKYAIDLEKRAYGILSKYEPNSANLSSVAYILGWLFVQAAEDSDDIDYGIKKIEEAKKIRFEMRGDELYPWMEDIYLKLGLSYQKRGDVQLAKDYFELLLQVQLKKYKGDLTDKRISETYKYLQTVYLQLNDKDGIEKCKKYFRYNVIDVGE